MLGFGGFHPKMYTLPRGELDWVGLRILRRLPRERMRRVVEHLARNCVNCGCIKGLARRLAPRTNR